MRKKVMQKIRNRISAQESRDRRKNQFSELINYNLQLTRSNLNYQQKIDDLQKENQLLKRIDNSKSSQKPQERPRPNLSGLTEMLKSSAGKGDKKGWHLFCSFLTVVLIYSLLYPDRASFSKKVDSISLPQFMAPDCTSPFSSSRARYRSRSSNTWKPLKPVQQGIGRSPVAPKVRSERALLGAVEEYRRVCLAQLRARW
jgi:hypothetical protein